MGGNSEENNERKRCSLPRPRYHIVGALACHVRLRFVRTSEIWAMKQPLRLPQSATYFLR